MPCHAAMVQNPCYVHPDQTIDDALDLMKDQSLPYLPVVDQDRVLLGLFSYTVLLKNILPVSVAGGGGVSMDITVRAAPGIAKRLRKVATLPVSDFMVRDVRIVHPETPTWEGINYLLEFNEPVLVIDQDTAQLKGIMTYHSAFDELQRLRHAE